MFSKARLFLTCFILATSFVPLDQLEARGRGRHRGGGRHGGGNRHNRNHHHDHGHDHHHDHGHDHHHHNHNHDHVRVRGFGRGWWDNGNDWDDWRGRYYGYTPYEGNYIDDYYSNYPTSVYSNDSNGSGYKYYDTYSVDESKHNQSQLPVCKPSHSNPPPRQKGVFFNH